MKKKSGEKRGMYFMGSVIGVASNVMMILLMTFPIFAEELGPTGTPIAGSLEVVAEELKLSVPPIFMADPYAADFVVTGSEIGPGGEHYFPSNGDGTFGSRSDISGLTTVDGVDVADMDGDGDNDILVGDGKKGEVYLYTNDGTGTFTPSVIATGVSSGEYCTNLRVGDFNNDGKMDFVVGDNRVRNGMFVHLQTSPGTFTKVLPGLDVATWSTVGGNSLFGVAVGDVDGDGYLDILVLGYYGIGAGQMRFYKGDGTGAMAASTMLFNIGTDFGVRGANGLALFDLEGDGDLDIIAGGGIGGGIGGEGTHFIYTNDGTGNFTKPAGFVFDVDAQTGIDRCDLDGDGDHDLVVAAFGPRKFYYVENLGGSLLPPVLVSILSRSGIGIGAPEIYQARIEVAIDIKPGSYPNPLNVGSKGVLPVAILGSADFDVYDIDAATIQLAGVDPIRSSYEDVSTPLVDADECVCSIEGPDGYMDFVLKFDTQKIVEALEPVEDGDEFVLEFDGLLYDGMPIKGEDCIIIRAKGKK